MHVEMLLRALFKFMGVDEQQMREVFEKGHALVIDGSQRIAMIDRRLERIERAMGISETNETKAFINGQRDETV